MSTKPRLSIISRVYDDAATIGLGFTGLCADIWEKNGEISPIYVQIPVIIEDFSFFFHKSEEFHKGEGV